VAKKALDNFKARIWQLTRRSGGRSLDQVVDKLRPYLRGWKAYFGLAQTPKVWRALDEWRRHRWWRNSDGAIQRVLTIAHYDRMGVPRLS
jgi:RNA-directed DNA polymerase